MSKVESEDVARALYGLRDRLMEEIWDSSIELIDWPNIPQPEADQVGKMLSNAREFIEEEVEKTITSLIGEKL